MWKHKSLRKLYLEITACVLAFSILGAVLFVQQKGFSAQVNTSESALLDEDTWYRVRNKNAGQAADNASSCLVLINKNDTDSIMLGNNMVYTLNSINVKTTLSSVDGPADEGGAAERRSKEKAQELKATPSEAAPTVTTVDYSRYQDIVLCYSDYSTLLTEPAKLRSWIEGGGHLMLADGIDENLNLGAWADILGIDASQKAKPVRADSLKFRSELMAGAQGREFSDDVISCDALEVTLRDGCVLHASTTDESCPLLWEYAPGDGKVMVCNADLMDTKSSRGLISAAYCRFYPVYAYPVINACVYCIDDCPSPIPAGYDKNIISQYGYTVSDFYANIWMPAMQKLAAKYDIKYSAFAIQTYENKVEGDFNSTENRENARYYAGLILNMGGEIGIHGYNHQPLVPEGFKYDKENGGYTPWKNVFSMLKSIQATIKYTESLSDELYVQAYVAPSNVISREAVEEMISQIESLRVYAGIYTGTRDQFVQEFEVRENGVVYCPRLTADMQMEDSEWWTQINELNYHYVESNFIHPDDILDEERSDGGDFNQMVAGYTDMIEWNQKMGLRSTTISECGAAVQRYCNLSYRQTAEENSLVIEADGLVDSAYMMVRTNGKRVTEAEGGEIKQLGEDAVILRMDKPRVVLKTVDVQ